MRPHAYVLLYVHAGTYVCMSANICAVFAVCHDVWVSVCLSVGRSGLVCVSVYLDQLGICYADVFVEAAPETASLLGDVTPKTRAICQD